MRNLEAVEVHLLSKGLNVVLILPSAGTISAQMTFLHPRPTLASTLPSSTRGRGTR